MDEMKLYTITHIDEEGKTRQKQVEVDNESQLQPYIEAMRLSVTNVEEVHGFRKKIDAFRLNKKVKPVQTIELLTNLQVIVQSGLPVTSGLVDMAEGADSRFIAEMLIDISNRVQMSMPLSQAMSKYIKVFGETTIGLVKIGEETGALDETLANAKEYMERIENMRSKVKSALILPIITLVALVGAMGFWMIGILPQLVDTFESFDMELPFFTKLFIAASDFLKANIVMLFLAFIGAVIALLIARKRIFAVKFFIDRAILKMPIFGNIVMLYNYAFISEYTRLMIVAGLPLYQALGILQGSLSNELYKKGVGGARELISAGSSLSGAMKAQQLFTPLVIRMIKIGEETGRLDEQLRYVADHYFAKVDYIAENIAKIIQPVITVVLGVFMIFMIAAFLLPIADLVTNMMNMQ